MRHALCVGLFASLFLWTACGGDGASAGSQSITKLIGTEGGTIELLDGTKIEFPPGALTMATQIKVTKLELQDVASLPSNLEAAGKPYAFEPFGLVLEAPVKIEVPFEGAAIEVRPMKLPNLVATTVQWTTVFPNEKVGDKAVLETTSLGVILAARPRRGSGFVTLPDGAVVTDDGGVAGMAGTGGQGGAAGAAGAAGAGGTAGMIGDDAGPDAGMLDGAVDLDAAILDADTLDADTLDATVMLDGDIADAATMQDAAPLPDAGLPWMAEQQAYIKASNTNAFDSFGNVVALSADGNTLAVGAYWESSDATGINGDQSNNNASRAGAVYVFTRVGETWAQQAYIKASNTDVEDNFGYALALSADGDTLAVGAYFEDSNATGVNGDEADNSVSASGAVYVFTRGDGDAGPVWSQQAYLKASNPDAYDGFGRTLAISGDGNLLAVAATAESSGATGVNGNQADNSTSIAGAVYVFDRSGTAWAQQAYLKASNPGVNDGFGWSLAFSNDGTTLAVSSPGEASASAGVNADQGDNSAPSAGAVYVFTHPGGVWSQQAYLKPTNPQQNAGFGHVVALSANGNVLATSAYYENSNATGINGNPFNTAATQSGAAYVFTRTVATWAQAAYLKASNADATDQFGRSLSLSHDGTVLAVGADLEDSNATGINGNEASNAAENAGAVYVFTGIGRNWGQHAYIKASNTGLGDRFGASVSIAGDGHTLVVGSPAESSNATGVNGSGFNNSAVTSGAAYVYAEPVIE